MAPLFVQQLRDGNVALGFHLMFPAAGIIECACSGWDWLWIDGQHGQHDYRSILECVRVADAQGVAPIVRVPGHEPGVIGRVMDMRPAGIMVPMVDSAKDARRVVQAMCFPPLGARSFGGRRAIDLDGREYLQTANETALLLAQIETPEALQNAGDIASVEGVDVLFFGPDDMKVRMGIPINTPVDESDQLIEAMRTTISAANKAGKIGGCVAGTPKALRTAVSMGYRLVVGGGDVALLRTTASARLAELQRVLGDQAAS